MAKEYNDHGIFSYELQEKRKGNKISFGLAKVLVDFLPHDYIVYDMGCGTAEYLEYLAEHGFVVLGFEGTPGINELTSVDVQERDLTKKLPDPEQTGSVISIEVAEHIPKKFEKVFVENLVKYTENHLIISWAVPNQGGVGHVNEKSSNDVIRVFTEYGFAYDESRSKKWRELAGKDLVWLKNSIYVFHRD